MAGYCWNEPKCLVAHSDENGLHINEKTVELLKKVKVPISVVAIVGPYRTGKSYLLNRLAGQNRGFDIGATVQAKTKGIWAWCRPHPEKKNTCLVLLDSEGLGDPEKGDKDQDIWIFSLAVLLSNTFIYNSKGTIDNDALEKLHFVTDISEHVKVKARSKDDDEEEYARYFPSFIWAVRDFHLKLEIDGQSCTPDEYMENALKIKPGASAKVMKYNLPRKTLKEYFPSRKCFVFPLPARDMEMMEHLESISINDLNKQFLLTADMLVQHVIRGSQLKTIHGASVTGSALANLCEIYVNAIHEGAVPCIESAMDAMAKSENTKAVEESLQLYRAQMNLIHFPTETVEQLSSHHQQCEKNAIESFMTASIFDTKRVYQEKLAEAIHTEYEVLCKQNEDASVTQCKAIINQLYAKIAQKIEAGAYLKQGGYQIYKTDMDNLRVAYNKKPGKGFKAADQLLAFLDEKSADEHLILQADTRLTNEQKKLEEERRIAELAKKQEEAAKAENKRMEKFMKDRERSHQEHINQLNDKLCTEIKNLDEKYQEEIKQKLRDQEELLRNGFKEEAQALQSQIETVKSKHQEETQGLKKEVKSLKDRLSERAQAVKKRCVIM